MKTNNISLLATFRVSCVLFMLIVLQFTHTLNTEAAITPSQARVFQAWVDSAQYFYDKEDYTRSFHYYLLLGSLDEYPELGPIPYIACEKVAYMYHKGLGTQKDTNSALFWYKIATEHGIESSWVMLGNLYQELQYHTEALHCFKKYVSLNTKDKSTTGFVQYIIGACYANGQGCEKDVQEAIKWYKLSANNGEELAMKILPKYGVYTNPKPSPNVNLAKLTWNSSTAETSLKSYNLKVGVNSNSAVTGVTVYVNDEVFRGTNLVRNDGYTSVIEKQLSLSEGNNLIKVQVRNSSGMAEIERNIYVKSTYTQPNDKRIALVIGNSNYGGDNRLNNPVNDASDLARKLERLGFYVIRSLDMDKQSMENSIRQFGQKAAGYDVALFYYAGHGIRCDGVNYLVPINASLPDETSVKYNCTNANMVLDYMENAGCKMKIVILDACRNNPFERSWNRAMDKGGLSIMNAPVGTFIAFSTAPGNVASDGSYGQRNSPYTQALLEMLDQPNVSLTDFFQEVLEKVATKTNDRQIPWTSNSFRGKFYFNKK